MSLASNSLTERHALRKRKIRKGTTSCWECKRRKVKCYFTDPTTRTCSGCVRRGTACLTQDYDETSEYHSEPVHTKSPRQRLGNTSEIEAQDANPYLIRQHSPASSEASDTSRAHSSVQFFDSTVIDLGQALKDCSPDSFSKFDAYSGINGVLHATLPSQDDADLIISAGYTPYFLQFFTLSYKDLCNGRLRPASSLSAFPPLSNSHPVLFARTLLYLAHGILCLYPTHQTSDQLDMRALSKARNRYVQIASRLVTNDDQLLNSLEGLECLILEGVYLLSVGDLRRAWQVFRRAIALAQLMGLHTGDTSKVTRVEANSLASPMYMWYRIVQQDRYLSLTLDLPPGCAENAISPVAGGDEKGSMMDAFEQEAVHLMGQVIIRNGMTNEENAYSMTKTIDEAFSKLAAEGNPDWWLAPKSKQRIPDTEDKLEDVLRILSHITHFQLLILLHLPYMLRGAYAYSRTTCINASRELLNRYVRFREITTGAFSCRSIDFSAFTASIVLLLVHVDDAIQRTLGAAGSIHQRPTDLALIKEIIEIMVDLNTVSEDKLLQHAANILSCLCKIEAEATRSNMDHRDSTSETVSGENPTHNGLKLSIPYVGRISITASGIFNESGVRLTTTPVPTDLPSELQSGIPQDAWAQRDDMPGPDIHTAFFSPQHIPVMNPLAGWSAGNTDLFVYHDPYGHGGTGGW